VGTLQSTEANSAAADIIAGLFWVINALSKPRWAINLACQLPDLHRLCLWLKHLVVSGTRNSAETRGWAKRKTFWPQPLG